MTGVESREHAFKQERQYRTNEIRVRFAIVEIDTVHFDC